MLYILTIYLKFCPGLSFPTSVYIMSHDFFSFFFYCLWGFFNLQFKSNDLGMDKGRHIKSCKKKLSISVMNTSSGGKSSNIYIFHCFIMSSSCYYLNNKQFIFPCSWTRHIFSRRTSSPAHSFTIQASC